ncbi:MAG: YqgE/AlgH family protein [Methylococcaceae bacterium]|nr:YqgE/AlgH family protein [Methylococcaceae bacterium]
MSNYLNNQFLIAMPMLTDKDFFHTVTYLCQHNDDGALGIIINRPTEMKLGDIFSQMGIDNATEKSRKTPIYMGGPVQVERGFVIHESSSTHWESSIAISEEVSLTSSRDILEAISKNEGPENYLIALGYAGWGAGQLEKEIINNAWLNTPYADAILYETPISQRWNAAANLIGVDINLLSSTAGHG